MDIAEAYKELLDKTVVVDIASPVVYIGRLEDVNEFFVTLADADIHDLTPGGLTKEVYLMEANRNGNVPNRKMVKIKQSEVLGLSLLDDVILY